MLLRSSLTLVTIVAVLSLLCAPAAMADDCEGCCYCVSGFCVESGGGGDDPLYSDCTEEAVPYVLDDVTIFIFYCEVEHNCYLV